VVSRRNVLSQKKFEYSFQASGAKQMTSALIWFITQRIVVIPCRRFRTTYPSHLHGVKKSKKACDTLGLPKCEQVSSRISWPLKMGQIVCAETSVMNYHYTLRDNPKERRSIPRILKFIFNKESTVKNEAGIIKGIARIIACYIKHKGY